jgi:hypothetical protein
MFQCEHTCTQFLTAILHSLANFAAIAAETGLVLPFGMTTGSLGTFGNILLNFFGKLMFTPLATTKK